MAGKKRNSSFEILTAMQDLNPGGSTPAGADPASSVRQHRAGASGAGESRAACQGAEQGADPDAAGRTLSGRRTVTPGEDEGGE